MKKGLIHIYCGDGKGKTTAAIGLAVRAAGTGQKVLIARFLKTSHSGELESLKALPNIRVVPAQKEFGFIRSKENPVWKDARDYYAQYFEQVIREAEEGGYDMLILDEINATVSLEIVEADRLLRFLQTKPEALEVVLTGRNPMPQIVEAADYVSEICKCKHPFDRGIRARKGIEF